MSVTRSAINGYINAGRLPQIGSIMVARSWTLTMYPMIVILKYSFDSEPRAFAGHRLQCDILAIPREWSGIIHSIWDWEDIEKDWQLLSAPQDGDSVAEYVSEQWNPEQMI